MLIRQADIAGRGPADIRIEDGIIVDLSHLKPGEPARDGAGVDEITLHANGGAIVPGLHDHHMHLLAFAASLDSVRCGPPDIVCARDLITTLQQQTPGGGGWIRGYGYHESVAGEIDRHWLDRHGPDVPVRIQHRSGRLWIFNSRGLALLPEHVPADGRLYDGDADLRDWLSSPPPSVANASRRLAAYGVTRLTDMTPTNDDDVADLIRAMQERGELLQDVQLAGAPSLSTGGPTKIHLHESSLPPFDRLCSIIANSHAQGRGVAVHCVTEVELVFTLAALRTTGSRSDDRIEHASVAPPALVEQIRELGLQVVTQPNFIGERGDAYAVDVPETEHNWLYRARGFLDRDVPLAGGTDAPFGHADPWRAMHDAVHRKTRTGLVLGADERLTPEQALALFVDSPIEIGSPADLCLLDVPWDTARSGLSSDRVRATVRAGELLYDRVDQPPVQRPLSR